MHSLTHIETQIHTPKVTLVLGPLGSGKTSLIKRLLPHYPTGTILIINDVGAINIDAKRLPSEHMVALKDGCVCCEDIESLRDTLIALQGTEQNIIIEPSGIAEGTSIKKMLDELGYDTSTIFLGDIAHHNTRSDIELQVIKNQIRVADIVGLTWDDDMEKRVIFHEWLNTIAPGIETLDIPKIPDNTEYNPEIEHYFGNITHTIGHAKRIQSTVSSIMRSPSRNGHRGILAHEKQKAPVFTVSREGDIGRQQLQDILNTYRDIIRAKGVVNGREFDFVHGNLEFCKHTDTPAYVTIISTSELELELDIGETHSVHDTSFTIDMLDFAHSQEKIDSLIADYHSYTGLSGDIETLRAELETEKKIEISQKITLLQLKQKFLGESMKYDNPFIWLEYKRLAYAGTKTSIKTIGDLKKHCSSPTYICHKRLMFLHSILQRDFAIDIFDVTMDDTLLLTDFLENGSIQQISQNPIYMQEWLRYEYFTLEDRVAKWENYTPTPHLA